MWLKGYGLYPLSLTLLQQHPQAVELPLSRLFFHVVGVGGGAAGSHELKQRAQGRSTSSISVCWSKVTLGRRTRERNQGHILKIKDMGSGLAKTWGQVLKYKIYDIKY